MCGTCAPQMSAHTKRAATHRTQSPHNAGERKIIQHTKALNTSARLITHTRCRATRRYYIHLPTTICMFNYIRTHHPRRPFTSVSRDRARRLPHQMELSSSIFLPIYTLVRAVAVRRYAAEKSGGGEMVACSMCTRLRA